MNKLGNFFKPLTWFMALLLAGLVAGCGDDDGGGALPIPPPTGTAAGVVCTSGATCVDLGTAGDFVILADAAITSVPTSAITGIVGMESGSSIAGLTCAEVIGSIIDSDAGYPPGGGDTSCLTTDGIRLTQALLDIIAAFADANDTVAHPVTASNPNPTLGPIAPGVYDFTGSIDIDTDVTLSGNATDVWIFQVPGDVALTTGNILLTNGALPQNVFWRVTGTVTIDAGRQFRGIVLADGTVALASGASVDGRLFSATDVTLIANAVTRPQ